MIPKLWTTVSWLEYLNLGDWILDTLQIKMWKENSLLMLQNKKHWFIFCGIFETMVHPYEANLNYLPATKSSPISLASHFSVENVEILLYPGKTKLTCTPNLGRGAKLFSCQIFKVTIWHNWQYQPWSHRNFHCKSQIW